jgi:protein ImuB
MLLLEVGSCLKLFHSQQQLQQNIAQGLTERGFTLRLGIADTPKAAALLARQASSRKPCNDNAQALQHVPLDLLPLNRSQKRSLQGMGMQSLGQLLALPSASLGKRLGPEVHRYLLQLQGELADPQAFITPPDYYDNQLLFDSPLTSHEMLSFPMQRLLGELQQFLQQRQWQTSQLHWQLEDSDKQRQAFDVQLGQAGSDRQAFLTLSRLQLEKQSFKQGILAVRLTVRHCSPVQAASLNLFDEGPKAASGKLSTVLDKLRARLGPQALLHIGHCDEHLPEAAGIVYSSLSPPPAENDPANQPGGERPCWLLTAPQPVQERAGNLYYHGSLSLLSGPERIESQWWQQGCGIKREYFIARQDDGCLFWLFRDLVQQRWFVHGIFA